MSTYNNKTVIIETKKTLTGAELMETLLEHRMRQDKMSILDGFRVEFQDGTCLNPEKTLEEQNIGDGTTLMYQIRFRGRRSNIF